MVTTSVKIQYSVKNPNSLHKATKSLFIACRLFGMFPVFGLMRANHKQVKFNSFPPYLVICMLTLMGQIVCSSLTILHLALDRSIPRNYYKILTHTGAAAFTLATLRLSRHWPRIISEAAAIEDSLPKFRLKNLTLICNLVALTVYILAGVDCVLSSNFYYKYGEACYNFESSLESYFRYTMPWAWNIIPFSYVVFFVSQICFVQVFFITNFADVLIMIASMYLTLHFKELNSLIVLYRDKYPNIWNVLRVHYTKLTRLVKLLDDHISPFVLLSFGFNLAMICINIFKILRKGSAHDVKECNKEEIQKVISSVDRSIYLAFSATFMIARILATAYLASRLHATARETINVLYEVPTGCYSGESHRFLEQIHGNTVALSGLHFFYVTKEMILAMAGTIVTYELVLLQFSDSKCE